MLQHRQGQMRPINTRIPGERIYTKRNLRIRHKETWVHDTRVLFSIGQQRPLNLSVPKVCVVVKRGLLLWQKRPTSMAKETYERTCIPEVCVYARARTCVCMYLRVCPRACAPSCAPARPSSIAARCRTSIGFYRRPFHSKRERERERRREREIER